LFRTVNSDDILLLPTQVNGFGYYSNVGMTQRQGIESGISYQKARWDISLNYALVQATFRESLSLSSNSPAADADGRILVRSGDRLPLTPLNRLTMQIEYAVNPRWTLGADVRYVDRQYLVGDESNQQPPLPDYAVISMHSSLEVSKSLRLFAVIDNVLDRQYYAFGAFTQLDGLPPNFNLTDPRTFSPSPGRTFFVGVSVGL
jgi:iron complex outermembrane receptor protein